MQLQDENGTLIALDKIISVTVIEDSMLSIRYVHDYDKVYAYHDANVALEDCDRISLYLDSREQV